MQHVLEIAALKGSAGEAAGGPEQLQESAVADQISLLSREWGWVSASRDGVDVAPRGSPSHPQLANVLLPAASLSSWCCT